MSDTEDWKRLSQALMGLHRALIQRARKDYEGEHGPIESPAQLLRLLTSEPSFAWLRPLSELIVNIDEASEFDDAARQRVSAAVRSSVEQLIAPPGATPLSEEFSQRYWPIMLEDAEVTMCHAGVKQAVSSWPRSGNGDESRAMHERHLLAEMVRQRHRPRR
jgi:hypothetical protein